MKITRREVLWGSTATALVTTMPTPAHAIEGLTGIETLTKLAAEDKYASVANEMPADVFEADFQFFLNGKKFEEPITEIFAPGGDDIGWAVVWKRDQGNMASHTEVVRGRWSFVKTPNYQRRSG